MNELEYAKMLEVPISSSSVEFKPTPRRKKDVKKQIINKVNNQTETTAQNPKKSIKDFFKKLQVKKPKVKKVQTESSVEITKGGFDVISMQVVAIFVLVVGIILTNIFFENSGMNNLMRAVFSKNEEVIEKHYTEFTALSPSKNGQVTLQDGVMTVSAGSVYSPCDGTIESVSKDGDFYVVTVSHSDSFTSVISGLESVYLSVGETVYSNVPVGYSSGITNVSMFSNDAILTGYEINDNKIVWLS
ncbi:MAG: M23 family metallopeptidase [Clostridiales bacterium]|nr:M23 family metallopeptidase [Clostridiales bacterium]